MLWLPQMREAERSEGAELDPVEVHTLQCYPLRICVVYVKKEKGTANKMCFNLAMVKYSHIVFGKCLIL